MTSFTLKALPQLSRSEATVERAKASDRPTVVCIRSDKDANMGTPGDASMRFVEVYQGPF